LGCYLDLSSILPIKSLLRFGLASPRLRIQLPCACGFKDCISLKMDAMTIDVKTL